MRSAGVSSYLSKLLTDVVVALAAGLTLCEMSAVQHILRDGLANSHCQKGNCAHSRRELHLSTLEIDQ